MKNLDVKFRMMMHDGFYLNILCILLLKHRDRTRNSGVKTLDSLEVQKNNPKNPCEFCVA